MLTIPPLIHELDVVSAPLDFQWDDKVPSSNYAREDHRLERRIAKTSDRGAIAFGAALAEWVFWRLNAVSDSKIAGAYIESVWAAIVDWAYLDPKMDPQDTMKWKDWRGKERGPLCAAAMVLSRAVAVAVRGEPPNLFVSNLGSLAELVVSDKTAFRKWRNWALDRLVEIQPFDNDEPSGKPLPREALDPGFSFKAGTSGKLIDHFLRNLDYTKNRFLRSPAEMLKAGFKGKPYRYES